MLGLYSTVWISKWGYLAVVTELQDMYAYLMTCSGERDEELSESW